MHPVQKFTSANRLRSTGLKQKNTILINNIKDLLTTKTDMSGTMIPGEGRFNESGRTSYYCGSTAFDADPKSGFYLQYNFKADRMRIQILIKIRKLGQFNKSNLIGT